MTARAGTLSALGWLMALALVHGGLYAALIPPWQTPDETIHYAYLRDLQSAPTAWAATTVPRQADVFQAVTASARDFNWWALVKLPTPAVPPATPTYDHHINRAGSLYYRGAFPVWAAVAGWPIAAQLYTLRAYSVALYAVTVALTYLLARQVWAGPDDEPLAWAAAVVVALLPQFTFISAGFSDDNLVPVCVTAALYALARGWRQGGDLRWWAVGAALAGLAAFAKRTGVGAVAVAGLALVPYLGWRWRERRWKPLAVGALGAVAVVALGMACLPSAASTDLVRWLLRVSPEEALAVLAIARDPGQLAQLNWVEAAVFWSISFWGYFGWLKAPLPTGVMEALRRLTVILLAGAGAAWLWAGARRGQTPESRGQLGVLAGLAAGVAVSTGLIAAQFMLYPDLYAPTGRYSFPFIAAWAILLVWGWQFWWPARWKPLGLGLGLSLLIGLDMYALGAVIVPYFYSL